MFTIGGNWPVYLARLIALAQSHHLKGPLWLRRCTASAMNA